MQQHRSITKDLKYYLREVAELPHVPISVEDKPGTYTASADYLLYTTEFHTGHDIIGLRKHLYAHPAKTITDVGCCSGMTGLMIALNTGKPVTFHDFEGLGLDFIRWFIERDKLDGCKVIPYGEPIEQADLAVALDVIEHTGNHLGFIHWMRELGKEVVVTYPLMGYNPPWKNEIDEWVDDEAIRWIVGKRYQVIFDYTENGRRFLSWRT